MKSSSTDYDAAWESLGSASLKNATSEIRPNSHDLVDANAVYNAINSALSAVYEPHGDLSCADLTSALLIDENVGNVYQMTDSGTTSALFINGAGITISANDSVGIIKAGQNTILFNYMGNVLDLHDYQKKDLTSPITIGGVQQTTVEGALGGLNTEKVTRKNISFQGTSDIIADIGTLVDTVLTLGNGTYIGEFSRTGVTAGFYALSVASAGSANHVNGVVTTDNEQSNMATYQVSNYTISGTDHRDIMKLADEKSISIVPLNNSTIYYSNSRVVGGIVTVCADIIVASGCYLTKEDAIASIPNLGTSSINYILPCLYRNTVNGSAEPSYILIGTTGNLYPYYTKSEYNEVRINASYASRV